MHKEYAIIKLHRRQGDCEVTGEVFQSTASLLKKVLSFTKQENKKTTNKNEIRGREGVERKANKKTLLFKVLRD